MSGYNKLTFSAGQEQQVREAGQYVYFESGNSIAAVSDMRSGESIKLKPGQGWHFKSRFDGVLIESTGAQDCVFFVSDRPPIDNRGQQLISDVQPPSDTQIQILEEDPLGAGWSWDASQIIAANSNRRGGVVEAFKTNTDVFAIRRPTWGALEAVYLYPGEKFAINDIQEWQFTAALAGDLASFIYNEV